MLPNQVMIVSILSSLTATLFTAIALISVDKNNNILQDLSWGRGHDRNDSVNYDIYVGVFQAGYQQSNSDIMISVKQGYTDNNCTATYCRTCHHYMSVVIGFLAAFVLMSFPSLYTNFARFHQATDTPRIRMIGILSSTLCVCLGLVSLIVFATTCFPKAKRFVNDTLTGDYNWTYGSAFILLAVSVCLKFVDTLLNVLVIVSERPPTYAAASSEPSGVLMTQDAVTQGADDKV